MLVAQPARSPPHASPSFLGAWGGDGHLQVQHEIEGWRAAMRSLREAELMGLAPPGASLLAGRAEVGAAAREATWSAMLVPHRLTGEVLDCLLAALTTIDELYLRDFSLTPPLLRSGIVYQREPLGQERWLAIHHVLSQGWGDCEDLACWRAAELRVRGGEHARPVWRVRETPKGLLYHIVVERASGRIEDPSLWLGMGVAA